MSRVGFEFKLRIFGISEIEANNIFRFNFKNFIGRFVLIQVKLLPLISFLIELTNYCTKHKLNSNRLCLSLFKFG